MPGAMDFGITDGGAVRSINCRLMHRSKWQCYSMTSSLGFRLRRFRWQPAIHHDRQPCRKCQGPAVPDRLRASAARQDLGQGARRRRRHRAHGEAYARSVPGAPRTGNPLHHLAVGRELSAAHPAALRGCRRPGNDLTACHLPGGWPRLDYPFFVQHMILFGLRGRLGGLARAEGAQAGIASNL